MYGKDYFVMVTQLLGTAKHYLTSETFHEESIINQIAGACNIVVIENVTIVYCGTLLSFLLLVWTVNPTLKSLMWACRTTFHLYYEDIIQLKLWDFFCI